MLLRCYSYAFLGLLFATQCTNGSDSSRPESQDASAEGSENVSSSDDDSAGDEPSDETNEGSDDVASEEPDVDSSDSDPVVDDEPDDDAPSGAGGTMVGGGGSGGSSDVGSGGGGAAGASGDSNGGVPGAGGTGAAGADGDGGASGNGGAGDAVGVLGQPCPSPGTLACAGDYQKLTLLCGASGTWESGGTCAGEQFCDTRPDLPSTGSCQDPHPSCTGQMPGYQFCEGTTAAYACNADTVGVDLVEQCAGVCAGGVCNNEADPCPPEPYTNCDTGCRERDSWCGLSDFDGCYVVTSVSGSVVRTLPAAEACKRCGGAVAQLAVIMPEGIYRVTVSPPWRLLPPPVQVEEACTGAGSQCIINGYGSGEYGSFLAVTDDLNAPAHNILIEEVPADVEGCPP